jgi:hypothetical protein
MIQACHMSEAHENLFNSNDFVLPDLLVISPRRVQRQQQESPARKKYSHI